MDISLPCSSKKRYLTGIDWSINALDAITKQATGHGNSSQVILVLNGRLDPADLADLLRKIFKGHPVLSGNLGRDWSLCPCWRMPGKPPRNLPLSVTTEKDDWEEIFLRFQRHVNQPFAGERQHLHFHLVNCGSRRSYLGMHFDHRLLDAFGAEAFLELIQQTHQGKQSAITEQISLVEDAHLDHWARRFQGGKAVNRLQIRLSRGRVAAFPTPALIPPLSTRFNLTTLSEEETEQLVERAFGTAGYFMLLPSLLAGVVRALDRLARKRGRPEGHYVIPVSVVNRTPQEKWEKLFFNHVSFIIFQIPVDLARERSGLIEFLRDRLYDHMKSGTPDDFYHASMLTRIVPLPLMRMLAKIPMRGQIGTSYFACLKESGYTSSEFMGFEVENLIHTPHVPPPPGIGVFLNQFRGHLNLVLSHLEGIFSPDEATELTEQMRSELLGESVED
ncbi:MAG: hypothetical protein KGZ25_02285, partial [Planctomycetes bacterium]|nr:hypothetical protein [Planctomycetota bacterium]